MWSIIAIISFFIVFIGGSPLQERIIGGSNANGNQFPYIVSIYSKQNLTCGGSILNKRWVVSALHCTIGKDVNDLEIRAGSIFHQLGDLYKVESIEIISNDIDICLIKLKTELQFSEFVQPIELNNEEITSGEEVTIAGWGYIKYPHLEHTEILQWINVNYLSNVDCKKYFKIADYEICTFRKPFGGVCRGDSGGPLAWKNKLLGIVAWGIPCAVGHPDVYTNVANFADWIQETINN